MMGEAQSGPSRSQEQTQVVAKRFTFDLPGDLVEVVFTFLAPREWVLTCGLVCKLWHDRSVSDKLWEGECDELWEGKANVHIGELYHRAKFQPSVTLSVKELKSLLLRRYVDFSAFREKSEFLEGLRLSAARMKLPAHVPLKGKWKASYAFSLMDSHTARALTDIELCKMKFRFFFKSNPLEFSATAWFAIDKYGHNQFHMVPWPMDHVTEMPWTRNADGDVVIHRFPAHIFFRRDDWSYGLQNDHVIFFQCDTPTFDENAVKQWLLESVHG